MKARSRRHASPSWFTVLSMLLLASAVSAADRTAGRGLESVAADIEGLRLESPRSIADVRANARGRLHPSLVAASGSTRVIVRLRTPAVAKMQGALSGEMLSRKTDIEVEQAGFLSRCQPQFPSLREIARTQLVLNAVFVEVDATALPMLALDPAVLRIAPVNNYELDLTETVPYIGGTSVQSEGIDGTGITVAVLDSGIDYTHANLGGEGTLEAYAAAYGLDPSDPLNTSRDGLFPTDKVVDGFDFVGEGWPNTPEVPDEDPIDFEGHGSHVADIIGGANGVAPGAKLVAVKVCSAISSSCSGIALIQGMEFAVDPNGNGDPDDAVDVINMSLGSLYGQPFDDDLAAAVDNATALGVLTVASAGNSGDLPYVSGTPAAAATAISVAQTQVPSATLQLIVADGFAIPAVFQAWSAPLLSEVSGDIQYADGAGGNLNGCAPFAQGSLTGLIVLVDRGACNFTTKIFNVGNAGGAAGIIGLVAPGAPFSGGFADPGGPIDIPGYMINQNDANFLRASSPVDGVISPANQLPLLMQMVGSSSRGPRNGDNMIKPDIGAPGASVSLEVGTGTGETPFGGTSGAAPMVAGAAALVLDAFSGAADSYHDEDDDGGLAPALVKALLSTNADINIDTDPFTGLAPITRIGGGEVRVDRALGSRVAAWDAKTGQGSLSFGKVDVWQDSKRITKKLKIKNLSDSRVWYDVTPTFRYVDDGASGAVDVTVKPSRIGIRPGATRTVNVMMTIHGELLPGNFMNSGSEGANGAALSANEFDGYVNLQGPDHELNVAWQVLPRQSARVRPDGRRIPKGGGTINLNNNGVGTAQNDAYA
ncbi:MAG: S8 family serine peptidase, partial [Gammaproteobacteria bacterium]|nr:S8 family serine peptidase [Gammaproteobacteria bacterium]